MTGIIVLLSLLSATLVMTNSVYEMERKHNGSDCIRLPGQTYDSNEQWNSTLCDYMKQFPLPEEYFITVCLYQKTVRIDFRKFINGKKAHHTGILSQTKSVELSEETSKVH